MTDAEQFEAWTQIDGTTIMSGTSGDDPFGYRAEFLILVRLAKSARP